MNKVWLVIIGGILVILAAGAVQFLFPRTAASPISTTPNTSATITVQSNDTGTTSATDSKKVTASDLTRVVQEPPSIAKGDTVVSWAFKGAYTDNPELMAKAEAEVKRLSGLIRKGTEKDVSLYVDIANQYDLIGDGKNEYDYLGRAIVADENATSGLPWHNLGVLMERLGALETARVAYEKSTLIQPTMKFYHYAYFEFLTTRMKDDSVDIEKEYTAALKNLGQDSDILQLYSEWKQI